VIPAAPRSAANWPMSEIFSGEAGAAGKSAFKYPEGMAAFDVDGDGKLDLLAGNVWLKHRDDLSFEAIQIAPIGGRISLAQFKPGKFPQIVIAPGDGIGPLRWYECVGNPERSADWRGQDLLQR